MSYQYQSYTTTSSSYDMFAPGKTSTNATGSSTTPSSFTLQFATAPTVNVGDLVYVTGGTFTGNTWNGFRYVQSSNATSITVAMPVTPGTYSSGTVSLLTPYSEFGVNGVQHSITFTANASGYLNLLTNYANTVYSAPANDNGSFWVPANTAVTLPIRGPALLQFKGASGTVISAVENP